MNTFIQSNKVKVILFSFVILFAYLASIQIALAQSEKGMEMSQKHNDKVASVVMELKELAGKDQNIGEEVRVHNKNTPQQRGILETGLTV